jgi:RTX calcium-binding nonapeptide repeat (4 copies)
VSSARAGCETCRRPWRREDRDRTGLRRRLRDADDTFYYFDGNTLYGGPGDDRLVGGSGQDVLAGGPGNDHIDGGGGGDTIDARDGERDWITCGKNAYNRRDRVYADKFDVIASDCEVVRRF